MDVTNIKTGAHFTAAEVGPFSQLHQYKFGPSSCADLETWQTREEVKPSLPWRSPNGA